MTRLAFRLLAVLASVLPGLAAAQQLRLYALDCGHAEFQDFAAASDTGAYDGRRVVLADPCFLIRHPKGWLLWDSGLPAQLPAALSGVPGFRVWHGRPLAEQLATIGVTPEQVGLLAFSHLHFDHVGNATLFKRATWILQRAEVDWAERSPAPVSMVPELFADYRNAQVRWIDGDADVFGDGTVRILKAPGHTPGSSVLLVQLPRQGPVLLSGDLFLTLEGRIEHHVPAVNADRAATLASMQRIDEIARRQHARVVIQHAQEDFERLPRPPAYWD
ncbi:MAG: N-acyl homoserine lactonase family protein [Oxalobacteraceae bacterium]|nr:MAG: N-acyl homoserine lactonase family protein [Oxalobacteraceae bacterium]